MDEERVYTVGPFGHVYCLSRQTHEEVWHISLTQSYETDPPRWGYTQNTILHGDLLYVAPMTESTGLIALNKRSGEIVWETGRTDVDVLSGFEGYSLASLTAGQARSCDQGVARDPLQDEPAHAFLFGKKTKTSKRCIARSTEWVISPT